MFNVAWMSGSPQGVLGWTQPAGVAMKWFFSLAGPRIESLIWPYVVVTKIAAAAAPIHRPLSVCRNAWTAFLDQSF